MAFLEYQLDPNITLGATSTTDWNRTKTYTIGGRLKQKFNWSQGIHRLNLEYRPRPLSEYRLLTNLYNVVMANAHEGFRAKDWEDYQLTKDNSTVTEVDTGIFQLQRVHTAGASTYLRDITKPVSGVKVYRVSDDAEVGSVDITTGLVSGLSSGTDYYAVGEFDIPATFVSDEWVTNLKVNVQNLWLAPNTIVLEEIRL